MISVEKLQAAVPGAATADPTLLADMIARAVAFVEQQTGRYFGTPEQVTEYLQGYGSRWLRLNDEAQVFDSDDEVDAVEERCVPGGDVTLLGLTDFAVRPSSTTSVLVRLGGPGWRINYEYAVTYTRGFVVDEGPADIEQLLIDLIALRLGLRGREGLRSESIGGYSYTRFGEGDLDSIDGAWPTIRAWRHPVVA